MKTLQTFQTLLALPYARQMLAFEEPWPDEAGELCKRLYPYAAMGSEGPVRWALDSMEQLHDIPHEARLDEALMPLAVHVGEPAASLNAHELRADLRQLCARLGLIPPTGREAVTLRILGVVGDMASGAIPAERHAEALGLIHRLTDHGVSVAAPDAAAFDTLQQLYYELDEFEELSRIGLTAELRSREEIMQEVAETARWLADSMVVEFIPQEGGLYRLCLRVKGKDECGGAQRLVAAAPAALKRLRGIRFVEHAVPLPALGEYPTPDELEEGYALDFWFEFEDMCLFYSHADKGFYRAAHPPKEAQLIPTTPNEGETGCLPESFLGASLLSLTADEDRGYVLRFDTGGVIELGAEDLLFSDGPRGFYLSPNFYTPTWLADEENASTAAYLEEQMATKGGKNLLESLATAPQPPCDSAGGTSEAEPAQAEPMGATGAEGVEEGDAAAEAASETAEEVGAPHTGLSEILAGLSLSPRERAGLDAALRPGESIRWATRPHPVALSLWGSPRFIMGLLLLAGLVHWLGTVTETLAAEAAAAGVEPHYSGVFVVALPLGLLTLWLLATPWLEQRQHRRTLYVITSERALIAAEGLFSWKLQRWALGTELVVSRENREEGRGSLLFSEPAVGFLHLPDVARAHSELRRAIKARRSID